MRPLCASASVLALGSAIASSARADSTVAPANGRDGRDPIAAEALFQHGKQLMDEGRTAEACRAFAESQRLDPAGGTLLRLALCHEAERRLASAWVEYLEVLRMSQEGGGDPAKLAERVRIVREHLQGMESRVPKLVVVVAPAARADGLRVTVNGQSREEGSWGVPIPVDPGDVAIVARAPGRRPFQETIRVDEGARPEVDVPALDPELPPVAAPVEPTPAAHPERGEGAAWKPLGLAAGGIGLAAIGVGTYFGIRAISKWNDSNAICPGTQCGEAAVNLAHDAKQSATIADVTLAAGALVLAAGVVLYVVGVSNRAHAARGAPLAVSF